MFRLLSFVLLSWTVLLVAVGLVSAEPARSNVVAFKYVALGDSYSSGEGVDPYFRDGPDPATGAPGLFDNRCHRSSRAYPAWIKRTGDATTLYAIASGGGKPGSLGGNNKYGSDANTRSASGIEWASWACSGARTWNLLPAKEGGRPQGGGGQFWDSKTQLDGADLSGADLVTLTVGGNNSGFTDVLANCAEHACNTPAYEQARAKIIDETKPLLETLYRSVAKKATGARILVLGYPQVFPAGSDQQCGELIAFRGEQDMLRRLGALLNERIEAAVAAVKKGGVRIEFVPVAARFAGHEVCGSKGAWINGIDTTPKAARHGIDDESFHPTLEGQRDGYAAAVNALLNSQGGTAVPSTPPKTSPSTPVATKPSSSAAFVGMTFRVTFGQQNYPLAGNYLTCPSGATMIGGASGVLKVDRITPSAGGWKVASTQPSGHYAYAVDRRGTIIGIGGVLRVQTAASVFADMSFDAGCPSHPIKSIPAGAAVGMTSEVANATFTFDLCATGTYTRPSKYQFVLQVTTRSC